VGATASNAVRGGEGMPAPRVRRKKTRRNSFGRAFTTAETLPARTKSRKREDKSALLYDRARKEGKRERNILTRREIMEGKSTLISGIGGLL